jgi:galactoside 2-L-fucosyltransferase 1/2
MLTVRVTVHAAFLLLALQCCRCQITISGLLDEDGIVRTLAGKADVSKKTVYSAEVNADRGSQAAEDFAAKRAEEERVTLSGLSGCIMVKDSNAMLVEWVAYHYLVGPLRRLIIGYDPYSTEDPADVMKRWSKPGSALHVNTTILSAREYAPSVPIRERAKATDLQHDYVNRQKLFFATCLQRLNQEGRDWTMLLDTDEFARVLPNGGDSNVHSTVRSMASANKKSKCLVLPRVAFSDNKGSSAAEFMTMAYTHRVSDDIDDEGMFRFNRWGKMLVDVSSYEKSLLVPKDPHAGLHGCPNANGKTADGPVPIRVNHYLGTAAAYHRKNDPRALMGKKDPQDLVDLRTAATTNDDGVTGWLTQFLALGETAESAVRPLSSSDAGASPGDLDMQKFTTSPPPKNNGNIALKQHGRVGNCMFEYASVVGMATKNDMDVCVIGRNCVEQLLKYFKGPFTLASCTPDEQYEDKKETTATSFTPMQFDGNALISGWLQNTAYFYPDQGSASTSSVRQMFTFKPKLDLYANSVWTNACGKVAACAKAQAGRRRFVGIHIRRTDVLTLSWMKFPPPQYFKATMEYFRNKYGAGNALFMVVSDDPKWCAAQQFFRADDVHVHDGLVELGLEPETDPYRIAQDDQPYMDMAVLQRASDTILSSGTFGWWASYLGAQTSGGDIFYYPDSSSLIEPEDGHYPESWLGLSVPAIQEMADAQRKLAVVLT